MHEACLKDATIRATTAERQRVQELLRTLTPREQQVMELVTQGMLNKQIAGALGATTRIGSDFTTIGVDLCLGQLTAISPWNCSVNLYGAQSAVALNRQCDATVIPYSHQPATPDQGVLAFLIGPRQLPTAVL